MTDEESRALGVSEPAQLESGRAASEVGLTPISRACVRGTFGLGGPQSLYATAYGSAARVHTWACSLPVSLLFMQMSGELHRWGLEA